MFKVDFILLSACVLHFVALSEMLLRFFQFTYPGGITADDG
jgi:hypothetical protein